MALWIILGVTTVACFFIGFYFNFKVKELEYKKAEGEYTQRTLKDRSQLEVEQEKTKQEQERTKQLEIKTQYHEKYGQHLYL